MSGPGPPPSRPLREIAQFLELANLGLNLPFAVAFLLLASSGVPTVRATVLILVAFVAARTAGHSFNRWTDRAQDARNPRTQARALVTGRIGPGAALGIAAASAAVVLFAAYLLNPLALALAPVAMLLVLGYSYTKRFTAWTTPFLGLVEAVIPAAVFIAVQATLAPVVFLAVGAMLAWATAFEMIHSLGDLESDRALGLHSVPLRLGADRALRLVPVLHGIALGLFAAFGFGLGLAFPYYLGIVAMAALAGASDYGLFVRGTRTAVAFRGHFLLSAIFLVGVVAAIFLH